MTWKVHDHLFQEGESAAKSQTWFRLESGEKEDDRAKNDVHAQEHSDQNPQFACPELNSKTVRACRLRHPFIRQRARTKRGSADPEHLHCVDFTPCARRCRTCLVRVSGLVYD